MDARKVEYSPRFVNFDECMLLAYSGDVSLGRKTVFDAAKEIFERINRRAVTGVNFSVPVETEE